MPTSPPSVTTLPTPPSRSDPANFPTRGDAFLTALPTFQTDTNAVGANVYANAVEAAAAATSAASSQASATASATAAASSAAVAAASAGAALWVSGTTYAAFAVVYSPVSSLIYRRRTAGAGTTDPSADPGNWDLVTISAPTIVTVGTASSNVAVGGHYVVTYAAGACTLTLPSSPMTGDTIYITIANGRFDTVVDRNGGLIMGEAANLTINNAFVTFGLRYMGSTLGWRLV